MENLIRCMLKELQATGNSYTLKWFNQMKVEIRKFPFSRTIYLPTFVRMLFAWIKEFDKQVCTSRTKYLLYCFSSSQQIPLGSDTLKRCEETEWGSLHCRFDKNFKIYLRKLNRFAVPDLRLSFLLFAVVGRLSFSLKIRHRRFNSFYNR